MIGPSKTIEMEYVACNLCGADDSVLLYRKPDTRFWVVDQVFNVMRCRQCGLGYVNPRPTSAVMEIFYPPEFYERRELNVERSRYEIQAGFLDDSPRGRVLDIGCAGGAFLKVLHERGWEVFGMDRFNSGGDEPDLTIEYGELPDLAYPSCYFEVVTAWAVFEHLHNPMAYFAEVYRILKAGGHLICLVTNLNSVWSRFAYCEDLPRHLYFYSARTLRRYATVNGLRLKRLDYSGSVMKPDSTDVFRVNLLRFLGVKWRDIYHAANLRRPLVRLSEQVARLVGRAIFLKRIEALFHITGVVVAVMVKE